MERKIGEIFEYNGEWYQCVKGDICADCAFVKKYCKGSPLRDAIGSCSCYRKDATPVIFEKLEKVGEPITVNGKNVQLLKTIIANCDNCTFYKDSNCDFTCYPRKCHGGEEGTYVEIKNKEDMEEKNGIMIPKEANALTRTVYDYVNGNISDEELIRSIKEMSDEYPYNKNNLKPFDLQAAKSGKPVCTRSGKPVRIICFDSKNDPWRPIVALVEHNDNELLYEYTIEGKERFSHISTTGTSDLMMLPEKKEGWINIYNADTTFYYVDGRVFETKDEAVKEAKEEVEKEQREKNEYIDTIRVEWEE